MLAIALAVGVPGARAAGEATPFVPHALLGPWQIAGPFPKAADGAEGLATDYLGGELAVRPPALPGNSIWRAEPGPVVGFSSKSESVSYAWTTFHSPVRQAAVLAMGADDGCRAFLNGRPVLAGDRISVIFLDQYLAPVTLEAGENTLLVKVENWSGPCGFLARLLPAGVGHDLAPTLDVRLDEKLASHSIFQFPDLRIEFRDAAGRALGAPARTAGHRLRNEAEEALKGGGRRGGWRFFGPVPAGVASVGLTLEATDGGAPLWGGEFPWTGVTATAAPLVITPRLRAAGRVVDAVTGEPIVGAKFLHSHWRAREDAQRLRPERSGAGGRFILENLVAVNAAPMVVFAPGYRETPIRFEAPFAEETTVRLAPGGRTVAGRVVDQDGLPVPDARVRSSHGQPDLRDEDVTDADGYFFLAGLRPNSVIPIVVWREDMASVEATVPAAATEAVLAVRREAPAAVTGVTVGARTGRPLPGVRLIAPAARNGGELPTRETFSDPSGQYRLALDPNVAAGRIYALSDRYEPQVAALPGPLTPGGTGWQPFALRTGQALTGRIVDPQGRPLRGVGVWLSEWEGRSGVLHRYDHSQTDGSFLLPNMPAGPVTVKFFSPPNFQERKTLELTPGVPHTVVLDPAGGK